MTSVQLYDLHTNIIESSDSRMSKCKKKLLREIRSKISREVKKSPITISKEEWLNSKQSLKFFVSNYMDFISLWWNPKYLEYIYDKEDQHVLKLLLYNCFILRNISEEYWYVEEKIKEFPELVIRYLPLHIIIEIFPDILKDESIVIENNKKITEIEKPIEIIRKWNCDDDKKKLKIIEDIKNISCLDHFLSLLLHKIGQDIPLWYDRKKVSEIELNKQLKLLVEEYSEYSDYWWDDSKIKNETINEIFYTLISINHMRNKFTLWFRKDSFDYEKYSVFLPAFFSEYFHLWWDKDKFDYECKRKDIEKIPFVYEIAHNLLADSRCLDIIRKTNKCGVNTDYTKLVIRKLLKGKFLLCIYCSDYFESWWDEKYYNDSLSDIVLYNTCKDKFKNVCKTKFIICNLKHEVSYSRNR